MRSCVFCKKKDRKSNDLSFFKFPADEKVLQLWIKNMNYEPNWKPSKYHHLCSQHFSSQCLDFRDQLFRLRKGSIPTIFYGHNENLHHNYRQILESNNLNRQDSDRLQKNHTATLITILEAEDSESSMCL
ncbi:THAP domain-containing protein 2-like [Microplitis demolitor]|uniref:THAP domain-containing protein 2-like n=1 Tax=Microplitis demolitor TaxID=69319 RepID=UPI00235B6D21|nr:THAP domain-containing protein 2-like [Microplitis demolitor]